MRTPIALAVLSLVALAGCAPSNYYYNFDISDPGAVNVAHHWARDSIEDADLKAEVLVDPTSFGAILLIITNKTSEQIGVAWNQTSIVGPDRIEKPLRPDEGLGWIEPGTKLRARLIPFELPNLGAAATAYDNQTFELVVPLTVRGQPRDYRIHLVAHAVKI